MGQIFSYSLYSSILLSMLYLAYKWMMAGENQHRYNRAALWLIYAVALLALPATGYVNGFLSPLPVTVPEIEIDLSGMQVVLAEEVDEPSQPLWLSVLLWVYSAGIVLALVQTAWVGFRLRGIIARGTEAERYGDKIVIVTDDEGIAPFSWWRYVVMSRTDWEENGDMILVHELQHLGLQHWIDLLVAQCVGIFQWYNPAAWLMREELKTVHEYQADSAVLASGVCARDYQMLLIKKAVGARFPSLANSLNHSKLKKRITMMLNQKSSASRRLRGLALVPALGVALAVTNLDVVASVLSDTSEATMLAMQEVETTTESLIPAPDYGTELDEMTVVAYKSNEKTSEEQTSAASESEMPAVAAATADDSGDEKKVYTRVETKPMFPGGEAEMLRYIMTNVRYPEAAFKAGTQGRVIAQFVVEKDGSIGDVKIMRSVSSECDEEAIRVIKSMPTFTPGMVDGKPVAVWYTLPVSFKLKSNDNPAPKAAGEGAVTVTAQAKAADSEQVYTVVEEKPEFPGGEAALLNYVGDNLHYPKEAYEKNIQGRVVVQFVVKSDGSIGQVKTLRKVNPLLDAEAERVISSLPKFTPGKMKGQPVSVWYTLPVSFKLKNDGDGDKSISPVKTESSSVSAPVALNGKAKSIIKVGKADSGKMTDVDINSVAIYLNGRNVAGGSDFLNRIDPGHIDSITVSKTPKTAIYLYVDKKYAAEIIKG